MSNKTNTPPLVRLDKRKIRSAMALSDVTVQQIADELGMTRQAVYNAMNGQNTTLDTVSKIAASLDVDPLSILTAEPTAMSTRPADPRGASRRGATPFGDDKDVNHAD